MKGKRYAKCAVGTDKRTCGEVLGKYTRQMEYLCICDLGISFAACLG